MNIKNWKASYLALKTEAGLSRIALAGCSLALVLLSYHAVTKTQTVVIQPFGLQKSAWVSEDSSSQSYKEAWGLSLAQILGNVSPGNLDFVQKRLSPLFPSSIHEKTMTALRAQVIMMKTNRVTTSFDPKEVVYEKSTDKVFIYGNYISQSPSVKPRKEKRTYEFVINMESYLPQVVQMDTYADEPHTEQRLEQLKKKEKEQREKEKKERA